MISKAYIILFSVLSFSAFAQNLTLDELLKLRKNEIGYVEEYLTNKNWSFLEATEPTVENMGSATFAYMKNDFDETAQSFLNYLYSDTSDQKRLGLQINKPEIYNSYLARIKSLGCKLIDSKVKNGEIIKIYQGQTTTFKISTTTVKNDFDSRKTVHYIFICDNEDYIFNIAD